MDGIDLGFHCGRILFILLVQQLASSPYMQARTPSSLQRREEQHNIHFDRRYIDGLHVGGGCCWSNPIVFFNCCRHLFEKEACPLQLQIDNEALTSVSVRASLAASHIVSATPMLLLNTRSKAHCNFLLAPAHTQHGSRILIQGRHWCWSHLKRWYFGREVFRRDT